MSDYKLTNSDIIIRAADNSEIPMLSGNRDYVEYLAWVAAGNTPDPVDPAPTVVPQSVSATQGGIALIRAGLMDDVQAVADAADTPVEVKWAWERATTWDRNSPALAYLAGKAGISDASMDALFVDAATITP